MVTVRAFGTHSFDCFDFLKKNCLDIKGGSVLLKYLSQHTTKHISRVPVHFIFIYYFFHLNR